MSFQMKPYEEKMMKSLIVYEKELDTIRAGRANPALLDKVTVDYYGAPTAINGVAQISVPDARTIVIQPWDASTLKAIERSILASDIGITPQNDGKVIRLNFPPMTEDRRKEICKQISKMGAEAKVNMRNIRREANDKVKEAKKAGELTEDEVKKAEKDTQDLTDRYIKKVDTVTAEKEKEVMAI